MEGRLNVIECSAYRCSFFLLLIIILEIGGWVIKWQKIVKNRSKNRPQKVASGTAR